MLPLSDSAIGALCATGSALTWAVINLLVRSLAPVFNSVTMNALRSTAGGAVIIAWIAVDGGLGGVAEMPARAIWLLAVSVVLAVGIGDTVFFESTRWLGLTRAMTVSMMYPLVAAVMALVTLGEPLTIQVGLGSLITLGGVALTVGAKGEAGHGERRLALGLGAAVLATLAWAGAAVLLKPTLHEVDAVRAQAVRLPVAAALLWATPWAWRNAQPFWAHGASTLWRLGALGAMTAASSVLFVAGLKHGGVAVATVLSSTAPVFAIPLGFFFLGERLSAMAIAGAILTIAGVAVLQL